MASSIPFFFLRGVAGGADLPADPDPNTTPPTAAQQRLITVVQGTKIPPTVLRTFALDGTTITLTPYILMEGTDGAGVAYSYWAQIGAGIATTPAAPGSLAIPGLVGAQLFLRCSANTGVKRIGVLLGA